MGVTELPTPFATYAFAASGVIAIAIGSSPTGIAAPAVLVLRSIGVTVSPRRFTTYAVTGRAIAGWPSQAWPRGRAGLRTGWVELFLGWTSSVSCSPWSPDRLGGGMIDGQVRGPETRRTRRSARHAFNLVFNFPADRL